MKRGVGRATIRPMATKSVRFPDAELPRLARLREAMDRKLGTGSSISESDVLRVIFYSGLEAAEKEHGIAPPQTGGKPARKPK